MTRHDTSLHRHGEGRRMVRAPERRANQLGWFSLALGLAELAAPRQLGRLFGMEDEAAMIRACGAREVATGIAILGAQHKAPFLWGRVAGDAMDLAALGRAAGRGGEGGRNAGLALVAVAGVTLLDIAVAQSLSAQEPPLFGQPPPPRDYSDRSGFAKPVWEMRGLARRRKDRGAKPESVAEAGVNVRSLSI